MRKFFQNICHIYWNPWFKVWSSIWPLQLHCISVTARLYSKVAWASLATNICLWQPDQLTFFIFKLYAGHPGAHSLEPLGTLIFLREQPWIEIYLFIIWWMLCYRWLTMSKSWKGLTSIRVFPIQHWLQTSKAFKQLLVTNIYHFNI